jgi:heme exporter protein B
LNVTEEAPLPAKSKDLAEAKSKILRPSPQGGRIPSFSLLRHDIRMAVRRAGEWASLILFFIVVIIFLPFAIGPEPDTLRRLAPGLMWLAVLLMNLLSLEKLFVDDVRDGTLDLLLLSSRPLPLIIVLRLGAHIVMMLLALAVVIVPAILMLDLNLKVIPVLIGSLLLGVPCLVLLGGMVGSVTLALRRHPAMLTLLLAPFYIPVLIFAVSACDAAANGASSAPHLLLLAALLIVLLPTAPFVISASFRNSQG